MKHSLLLSALLVLVSTGVGAAQPEATPSIASPKNKQITSTFDLRTTQVEVKGRDAIFSHTLEGESGKVKPVAIGKLEGSGVAAYVWPTTLDSATVGFDAAQGILALAVTAHPDFDDTPLYDENGDGNKDNDGNEWHSHWVVLVEDEACGGKGALKVKDIPPETQATLPKTAPGLPILIDSPGYAPELVGKIIKVNAPVGANEFRYDGVTANLKVNDQGKAPLLCVVKVHDVASGDLSLPGKLIKK